jgi:putative FmdB family regulatory protein
MPIYEYECGRCRSRFELKRHFSEEGETPCPKCQGDTHRMFSPVPIIFKGSGFFATDSRKEYDYLSDESKTEKIGIV